MISKAATRLSPAPHGADGMSWGKAIAFRNRLIHGYWSVDYALVWDVIIDDLPLLKQEVARLVREPSG